MVNTRPQVCVFPLSFNGLEFGNSTICPISCHVPLQNNAAMLAYGSPQPQVCLCVSTIIPQWTGSLKLHVMFGVLCSLRTLPRSAVSSLRCVHLPSPLMDRNTQLLAQCHFMFLCSSESSHDGHHAASGVCLYRPLRDRNTHHTSNGCALSRTLSRWAISNLMCVPRFLRRSINGQEYSIIRSISCHVRAFPEPRRDRRSPPSGVWVYSDP
jgi:hypothetical protein